MSSEDSNFPDTENQPGPSQTTMRTEEEVIKSVVAAVMNKQEVIVRNIAKEACAVFTVATERKIETEIEERIRKKQKFSTPNPNNRGYRTSCERKRPR